jgi:cell division protein FtsZ
MTVLSITSPTPQPEDLTMQHIEFAEEESFHLGTQIKVIGVGGGGGNAVEHMIAKGVRGVEFICANTDAQALQASQAGRQIQLGTTGLGAGTIPAKGRDAAEQATETIREAIAGAHMLFITAGMGGGTGTGAAPVIARIAKEMGILTVAVVTRPFDWEGNRCMRNADAGLTELEANVDSLIVVLNDKLLEVLGEDITQEEAFAHANDVLKNAVGGIAEVINVRGNVNADFEDVKTVMSEPGKAMMGTAVAKGPDRARLAAEQAIACPLLEGVDLSGAKGVLVLITAARTSLKLSESRLAMNTIKNFASEDAHVIYGTAYDESLGDEIRITVLATGLGKANRRSAPQLTQVLATGTYGGAMQTPQAMQPTIGAPTTAAALFAGAMPAPNYQVPALFRNHPDRTNAAARVDALSSSGMDDVEIPAFLRKQAD